MYSMTVQLSWHVPLKTSSSEQPVVSFPSRNGWFRALLVAGTLPASWGGASAFRRARGNDTYGSSVSPLVLDLSGLPAVMGPIPQAWSASGGSSSKAAKQVAVSFILLMQGTFHRNQRSDKDQIRHLLDGPEIFFQSWQCKCDTLMECRCRELQARTPLRRQ